MIDRLYLTELLEGEGFPCTEETAALFDRYAQCLVDWNQKMNLTAITEPAGICVKHFLDSLMLLRYVDIPEGASLIDVGTGAGFPSVPCRILRPDLTVTLLDSLQKRIRFLEELSGQLVQKNRCIHSRAEDGGQNLALREQFDLATARAVAHLRELSEYCLPFVRPGGIFAALKGGALDAELEEAVPAIKILGGAVEQVKQYALPGEQARTLVIVKKVAATPSAYPRPAAKIKKFPLR